MSVSTRLRFEVLKRDGFRCRYCGVVGDDSELHVDHIVPRAKGGTDDPRNLATACVSCNSGKSAISLHESALPGLKGYYGFEIEGEGDASHLTETFVVLRRLDAHRWVVGFHEYNGVVERVGIRGEAALVGGRSIHLFVSAEAMARRRDIRLQYEHEREERAFLEWQRATAKEAPGEQQ